MTSYVVKQVFKTRFWKHVWELDSESLRDLLEAGNPFGHVNFEFCVPSDHGYPLIDSKFYLSKAHKEIQRDNLLEEHFEELEQAVKRTNVTRKFYLDSTGLTATEIVWKLMLSTEEENYNKIYDKHILRKFYCGDLFPTLPNGSVFCKSATHEMLKVLWDYKTCNYINENEPCLGLPSCQFRNGLFGYHMSFDSIFGILLGRREVSIKDIETWEQWDVDHRALLLCQYPEQFYKKLQVDASFSDRLLLYDRLPHCLQRRLWKMLLVKIDPERWPTLKFTEDAYEVSVKGHNVSVNGLENVSREELQAMYEGHPNNVSLDKVIELEVSDRPAKKMKTCNQQETLLLPPLDFTVLK